MPSKKVKDGDSSLIANLNNETKILIFEIKQEQKKTVDYYQGRMKIMKAQGLDDTSIKNWFGTGAALLEWQRMKNAIRHLVSDYISRVAEIAYLLELMK